VPGALRTSPKEAGSRSPLAKFPLILSQKRTTRSSALKRIGPSHGRVFIASFARGLFLAVSLWNLPGSPVPEAMQVGDSTYRGIRYTACLVELPKDRLRLFWKDPAGRPFGNVSRLLEYLNGHGEQLLFATNAGMYEADLSPVGWYVEEGKELFPVNLRKGWGNFYLKPNGVFAWSQTRAWIGPSEEAPAQKGWVQWATQSGPLLVHHGRFHPALAPDSRSRHIRNGVGLLTDQKVLLVVTKDPVTLYELASLFRWGLRCKESLYLDGSICSLYAPSLGYCVQRGPMGPILALVAPGPSQAP
jgi:uncharacterized protein YigE (DUF2233 family)